jgi:hypothetical protein
MVTVMVMGTDSADISYASERPLVFAGRDGIQEQVELLNELSRKLDEYFALRSFGPKDGDG